MLGVIQLV